MSSSLRHSDLPPPSWPQLRPRSKITASSVYATGTDSDPNLVDDDRKIDISDYPGEGIQLYSTIGWGLLRSLLARHKLRLAITFISLFCCTTCTLSMPLYAGRFFEVLVAVEHEPLWKLLCELGVLYALEPVFTVIFVVNLTTMWEKVMLNLRAHIFQRVLIHKVEFFDRYKVGEITALLTSDLGSLKDIVTENVSRDRGFRALSEVVGIICILFIMSPQVGPLLSVLMLTVSVLVAIHKRYTVPVFRAHGMAQASIADCVTETFSAIRTVRSFGGEKRQMSMFGTQVLASHASGIKLGIFKSINESLTRIAVYISWMALFCLGGSKVKAGELSLGNMASVIGYTSSIIWGVQGLVNAFGDLHGVFAAIGRINSVLKGDEIDEALAYGLERDIKHKKVHNKHFELFFVNGSIGKNQYLNMHYVSTLKSGSSLDSLAQSGDLCLEDVHFYYPLRPDMDVLNGLNLTLKCGTVTALVGSSGAGKSTVVQLLARFYEPTTGRITVAGEDVRIFDKINWARVVSLVNQDPVLFSASVGENIAFGCPDNSVSKDDVIKVAKAANAHDFINSLPQGYETLVGERGGLLSGGQRQRIAIARALLKSAPILILDEATSALDAVSECLVQDALNLLMKGRTTLAIAHRLSTIQNAHQIALCSEGKVVELGTHLELLGRKGHYASLVATQRLAFE